MTPASIPVRLLPLAERDVLEAVDYLAAESPAAARRFAEAFEGALSRLSSHPELGRTPRDEALIALGYRVVVVGDYLVFYVPSRRELLVHRVIHGARDLGSLL